MKRIYQNTLVKTFKDPLSETHNGHFSNYDPEIVFNVILSTMAEGEYPVEVAARLHISEDTFKSWLKDPAKEDLRQVFAQGYTLFKAFWHKQGRDGALGKIDGFRDATYKSIMENEFQWSTKTENKDTTQGSTLSNEELDARIKALLTEETKVTDGKSPE